MTDPDALPGTETLDARLYAMLGEVDEHEKLLLQKQEGLLGELALIEDQLARIAAVRTAVAGDQRPVRRAVRKRNREGGVPDDRKRKPGRDRRELLRSTIAEHGPISVRDLSDRLGLRPDAIRQNIYWMADEGDIVVEVQGQGPNPTTYRAP